MLSVVEQLNNLDGRLHRISDTNKTAIAHGIREQTELITAVETNILHTVENHAYVMKDEVLEEINRSERLLYLFVGLAIFLLLRWLDSRNRLHQLSMNQESIEQQKALDATTEAATDSTSKFTATSNTIEQVLAQGIPDIESPTRQHTMLEDTMSKSISIETCVENTCDRSDGDFESSWVDRSIGIHESDYAAVLLQTLEDNQKSLMREDLFQIPSNSNRLSDSPLECLRKNDLLHIESQINTIFEKE